MTHQWIRPVLRLLILGGVFIVGLALGTYYATETNVLLGHWFGQVPDLTINEPTVSPTPLPDETSRLELQNVPEPVPLVFSDTLEEATLQEYLKEGAVVLPLGKSFGEPGNVVVTAHSSGTQAFGPYRFAFAKLSELEEGQEFKVSTPKARYTYRVYGKEIVWPHEVDRLPNDDRSTITLVTCWPLWTNFKRLLVHAELIRTENQI
jgi:sortase A